MEAVQSLSASGEADIPALRSALERSLSEFNGSATRAIKRLYAGPKREKEVYHDRDSDSSESRSDSGNEGTEDLDESTGPNETVFLVYLYVFFLHESDAS